ncbi:AAA family ATPase [Stenotrophomonas maltophilia]|uniref:AAA family ATPase n=1 Tax=Stenotrophomonas maltophilia TaxID=40324 RepID=UPI0021C96B13|nr:AAA family ATPase [Stenotrophomonas maltophilia]MCU1162479.1 AAA family ATPase [Stenotrophomonas maltophilia]
MSGPNMEVCRWLGAQQDWIQEAAKRLLDTGTIDDREIDELVALLKDPAGQKVTTQRSFENLDQASASAGDVRLVRISDLSGIENLAPRNPLQFGDSNLVVIYGHNGAGKSGYTRLLKRASGKPRAAPLRINVFKPQATARQCGITLRKSGAEVCFKWKPDDEPIKELLGIDIFDSDEAGHYLSKESAASYTPPTLAMFSALATVCDRVKARLQIEQDGLTSALPKLPSQHADSAAGRAYASLSTRTSSAQVSKMLAWHDSDQSRIDELQQRLAQTDPAAAARSKRATKRHAEKIAQALKLYSSAYSDDALTRIRLLRSEATTKRKAARDAGLVRSAKLQGIGSDSWILLWKAAKSYSQLAYPHKTFPVVNDEDARCVLCQQALDSEAQQRLGDFEAFVEGTLAAEAEKAEKVYKEALSSLPQEKDEESIRTVCRASALDDSDFVDAMIFFWSNVSKARRALLDDEFEESAISPGDLFHKVQLIQEHCDRLEEEAILCDQDAVNDRRSALSAEKSELEARLWIAQQAEAIDAELKRLRSWKQLEDWKSMANSRRVSLKAGEISEKLITEEYVKRFNLELKALGASRLKVELVKTRSERGRALHRLQLAGALQSSGVELILSEGERRVVSLAAFLADVAEKSEQAPFVFDDPISSLDQTWEETTASRLINLSSSRQVIVFTHRLSMLSQFADVANVISIRQEPWGAGETGEVPLYGKAPEKALNDLRTRRLSQARKLLETEGYEASYPLLKAICSDFRILVERFVEMYVLADVVQRHRRDVNTKGKLQNLLKLNRSDCDLFSDLMTKLSKYEHSQSNEAPVELPSTEELDADMNALAGWYAGFKARPVPVE